MKFNSSPLDMSRREERRSRSRLPPSRLNVVQLREEVICRQYQQRFSNVLNVLCFRFELLFFFGLYNRTAFCLSKNFSRNPVYRDCREIYCRLSFFWNGCWLGFVIVPRLIIVMCCAAVLRYMSLHLFQHSRLAREEAQLLSKLEQLQVDTDLIPVEPHSQAQSRTSLSEVSLPASPGSHTEVRCLILGLF